ncbi:TetR/AcrR family transcriptional regulator [Clostridiaceae bacterium HSG29]|nr:TetR/AcrR family transcriptional regulator [Clostridiaceae bacterium HSG29]
MLGKREKKKVETKKKIIEVAYKMFDENGYENTSINDIAKESGLGVGTVYNYFPSKDNIFVETFEKKMQNTLDKDYIIKKHNDKEVYEIINEYINNFDIGFKYIPKQLLLELFRIVVGSKKNMKMLNKFAEMDFKFIDKIEVILIELKNEGKLNESADARNLSEIIYSIYAFELMMYIYNKGMTFEEATRKINKKVYILFKDYSK